MSVRVRFAPSPTGFLHIGGARTALFNYLFARQNQGQFILRIEDTDVARSSDEMTQGILDGLSWLGLDSDEGPIFQSERLNLYRRIADRLLAEGKAYRCFAPPEDLEKQKQDAQARGGNWRFDETSRNLSEAEAERRAAAEESHVVRFKVPDGRPIRFKDRVFKKIETPSEQVEDFVLLRSDGMPTYHLAVVADDIELGITDVIRGVDHLLNTNKHILIYLALGAKPPRFAHLPLILGNDRKRLSKRHGATSVTEYRNQGFLPGAVRNYLALLGWSPKQNREIFSDEELIAEFELGRVNKADAVFDLQKLEWMNGKLISDSSAEDLEPLVKEALEDAGLWQARWGGDDRQGFLNAIQLLKPRMRTLRDFATRGRPYFCEDYQYEPDAVSKFLKDDLEALTLAIADLQDAYSRLEPFDLAGTEEVLRDIGRRRGVETGRLIGGVRVALTGSAVAPGLFDVIVHLGRERTTDRLRRAVEFLR